MRRVGIAVAAVLVLGGLAACAPKDNNTGKASSGGASSVTPNECLPDRLQTKTSETFTFGTDQPVYEPWFVDNKPTNGKGFESAAAYAVANKLGYRTDQVSWVRVSFNAAIAPGPKKFDADINEFSITAARAKAVDFSSGYYDVTQAVVALKGSKAAAAKSVADLRGVKLGAQVGTTSYDAITDVIKPTKKVAVYNTNDDAVAALKNKQIDGLVVDLPTAFYITSAQVDNSTIVGQLPSTGGQPEQFGLVLDKGSALTSCVSQTVDALRKDGTLAKLADQWLSQAGAPKLS